MRPYCARSQQKRCVCCSFCTVAVVGCRHLACCLLSTDASSTTNVAPNHRTQPNHRHLPCFSLQPAFWEAVTAMQPDLAVTAAYGNMLPTAFLNIPKHGVLNIHPSLLPQYRGAAPVQRAVQVGSTHVTCKQLPCATGSTHDTCRGPYPSLLPQEWSCAHTAGWCDCSMLLELPGVKQCLVLNV
jgi:hypothetical protein